MVPPPTPSFWVAHGSRAPGLRPQSRPPAAWSLTGDRTASADGSYSPLVTDARLEFEPEPWGDDPQLREVLGEQGAAGFRGLLDGFPEPVGLLWAIREGGEVVDFAFGYGNPAMVSGFRIPAETPDRYTLLEALPRMRGSHAFDAYVDVCDRGEPWVSEVTYDTPFGDGYMLGTFLHRAARIGDGVIVFLHDVTASRRMEAELVAYADVVAHDLSAPLAGIAMLVKVLELRPDEPPAPDVLQELRATSDRARELVDGVLDYARSGELVIETVSLQDVTDAVAADLRPQLAESGGTLVVGDLPEVRADPRQLRRVVQNLVGNALKFRGRGPASRRDRRRARTRGVDRERQRQRHRDRPRERATHLRDVLAHRTARGGKRHRPRRVPAGRRGPRRADLGGARGRRRQRIHLHAAGRRLNTAGATAGGTAP